MADKILIDHLKSSVSLSKDELSEITHFFNHHSYKKKEIILTAEMQCDTLFFVAKGCLQLYFIDNLGNHKTTQFAIEHWWLTDFLAFQNQKPSNFYIETVENSEILSITFSEYQGIVSSVSQDGILFQINLRNRLWCRLDAFKIYKQLFQGRNVL